MKNALAIAIVTVTTLFVGAGSSPASAQEYIYAQTLTSGTATTSYDFTKYNSYITVDPTLIYNASGETFTVISAPTGTTPITSQTEGTIFISYDPANPTYVKYSSSILVGGVTTDTTSVPSVVTDNTNTTTTTGSTTTVTNTTSETTTDVADQTTDITPLVLPSVSGNLTVNDTGIAYVAYGGSATLRWESEGTSNCELTPIGQTGTSGQHELQDITSNLVVTLTCDVAPGFANYLSYPSWFGKVEVKVLPPTLDYLRGYISAQQSGSSKKVNVASTTALLDQAQKSYDTGKTELAKSFLQKTVSSLRQQAAKTGIATTSVTKYEDAVEYLEKTFDTSVTIAPNGCSVTATGPAGFILEHGANYQVRKGYGQQIVIPESGAITQPIYAQNGWTATGEVIDADGRIYARAELDVLTDDCPMPPVVYDPSVFNGYPEKWAIPETGTVMDDWGYYNRTPESYVAYQVTNAGQIFPTGYGTAFEWLDRATADNLVVESPQTGDVAINTFDASHGGPVAWYVDSIDELGNYQMSAIRSDGNMIWSGGTVEGESFIKYIRFPNN